MTNPFAIISEEIQSLANQVKQIHERLSNHSLGNKDSYEDRLLTKKQAAAILGVHINTIDNMRRQGRLKAIPMGTQVRFRLTDVKSIISDGYKAKRAKTSYNQEITLEALPKI